MAKSLEAQFADWVREQPADEPYSYSSAFGCAMFRFLSENGYPVKSVVSYYWKDTDDRLHRFADKVEDALNDDDMTFGALADRLA